MPGRNGSTELSNCRASHSRPARNACAASIIISTCSGTGSARRPPDGAARSAGSTAPQVLRRARQPVQVSPEADGGVAVRDVRQRGRGDCRISAAPATEEGGSGAAIPNGGGKLVQAAHHLGPRSDASLVAGSRLPRHDLRQGRRHAAVHDYADRRPAPQGSGNKLAGMVFHGVGDFDERCAHHDQPLSGRDRLGCVQRGPCNPPRQRPRSDPQHRAAIDLDFLDHPVVQASEAVDPVVHLPATSGRPSGDRTQGSAGQWGRSGTPPPASGRRRFPRRPAARHAYAGSAVAPPRTSRQSWARSGAPGARTVGPECWRRPRLRTRAATVVGVDGAAGRQSSAVLAPTSPGSASSQSRTAGSCSGDAPSTISRRRSR